MKQAVRIVAMLALVCGGAVQLRAQTGALAGDVLKDWQDQGQQVRGLAAAMPDDKFGFKPTPAQRSFAQQVTHIAEINVMVLRALGARTAAPQIDTMATTKAAALAELAKSYTYGEAVIREFNDAAMAQGVDGPPFLGRSTRARLAYFAMSHAMDSYGQMVVYLRLNNIVPPASAGM
ncbi:MAG: DinB family protein [Acidobacteria bacterium]|nr:DinB family protein [Acidobacteriota bacterium]